MKHVPGAQVYVGADSVGDMRAPGASDFCHGEWINYMEEVTVYSGEICHLFRSKPATRVLIQIPYSPSY